MSSKLALGTVQFGADYGINNKTGRIREEEARRILQRAAASGVDLLDTAQAYGESETVLGRLLSSGMPRMRVVSKFQAKADGSPELCLADSCARLGTPVLYGFMYHRFDDLSAFPSWHEGLLRLRDEGRIEKIGFSVYHPREVEALFEQRIPFDLVQLPYSVFDRRFESLLPELRRRGVEVHVRSVFLQGLAFKSAGSLPPHLSDFCDRLTALGNLSKAHSLPIEALCLGFAVLNPGIDRAVVGVDGLEHFEGLLRACAAAKGVASLLGELDALRMDDEKLLLPQNWGAA